jgi:L-alanine-DL-glutamate epimerase-like enolase superfamily enzyme
MVSPAAADARHVLIEATAEAWPLAEPFVIARGARTETHVVVASVQRGGHVGRGECVPYPRYGETVEGVVAALRAAGPLRDRAELARALPAGAARNALDCALWDLEAKEAGLPVHRLAGLPAPTALTTCYTLSLGAPEAMAAKARAVADMPLLKLKLGGAGRDGAPGDAERLRAVRAARPDARLVADANESWKEADLPALLAVAAECGLEMLEQPLPAGRDEALAAVERRVAVCADESAHTSADLASLAGLYDAVNIKLDKAGGLSEALAMAAEAGRLGLATMVGCMVGTSLAMAPALLVGAGARWIDLDAPLLLARDRPGGLIYRGATVMPPTAGPWG